MCEVADLRKLVMFDYKPLGNPQLKVTRSANVFYSANAEDLFGEAGDISSASSNEEEGKERDENNTEQVKCDCVNTT